MTPKYGLKWLKPAERRNFTKESIVQSVEEFLLKKPLPKEADQNKIKNGDECFTERPTKKMKLLNYMSIYSDLSTTSDKISTSINKQVENYLSLVNTPGDINTRDFWLKYEAELPDLAAYAKHLLAVPATSAPVERIFSVGGAILRPARRRLSDKNFEILMFLKCNLHLFKNY